MLLGMASLCVDVGVMYVRKQANVNGCDAAALAGALELPEDRAAAEREAIRAARANGLKEPIQVTVSFIDGVAGPAQAGAAGTGDFEAACYEEEPPETEAPQGEEVLARSIEVRSSEDVGLGFARIFGINSRPVRARAVAHVAIPNRMRGLLRPWGIDDDYRPEYGELTTVKFGANGHGGGSTAGAEAVNPPGGNFGIVNLGGGNGAPDYIQEIKYGGDGVYSVGDMLPSRPGNRVGPTRKGVEYLLKEASQAPWRGQTWQDASFDNPRVVILPVVDWDGAGNGRTKVPLRGFSAFYLSRIAGGEVQGMFMKSLNVPNGELDSDLPTAQDRGVRTVKLVQ
jgi:putative Tad-like protein involved in Flp pilus assembly